jgi:hypothetical protein
MSKSNGYRGTALAMAMLGALAIPAPAAATPEELHECLHNCYIAYVVQTQQPAFYDQCRVHCFELYDNFSAPDVSSGPLAVTRYN